MIHLSCSLNSSNGVIYYMQGSIVGVIKGDAGGLDSGSFGIINRVAHVTRDHKHAG